MAKDMAVIVKLLVAIRESEESPVFNPQLISESTLGTTEQHRDNLAIKLQNAGLLAGLVTTEDINNVKPDRVLWQASEPSVTLTGIEYMEENASFKKTLAKLSNAAATTAALTLEAALGKYL